ncbi:hypothetical protein V5E97_06340 [Singulisphaera sp. Ch08]|uniref:Uncharacterized protein n=1 Tax=Singulisphaera sp. Ch08 TaxID=3120278 RepID=A0AAU7CKI3_9BACT
MQAMLGGLFPSNKAERDILLNILDFCGILRTSGHPGYSARFVPMGERQIPPHWNVEMAYPTCWWRGRDGLNRDIVQAYFPGLDL